MLLQQTLTCADFNKYLYLQFSSVYFTSTFLVHFIFYWDLALSEISSFELYIKLQTKSNYSNFDLICSQYCYVSLIIDHMSQPKVREPQSCLKFQILPDVIIV